MLTHLAGQGQQVRLLRRAGELDQHRQIDARDDDDVAHIACEQAGREAAAPALQVREKKRGPGPEASAATPTTRSSAAGQIGRSVPALPAAATPPVLGGNPASLIDIDPRRISASLSINGDVRESGSAAAVLGNPVNAVAWLANAIGKFGVGLKAGEVIMPGALTAASDVAGGDVFRACFDGLGTVSVRFV